MASAPFVGHRSSAGTKARIVAVAKEIFSQKGYSHAGLREIASMADVTPSLVMKYFGTKAKLFEEALVASIVPIQVFQRDRAGMGAAIVAAILDAGSEIYAPAMIALSLGDAESRGISERVVRDRIVDPMARWLAPDCARAIALNILAMTTGFAIFHRNMDQSLTPAERDASAALFARSLQDLVDLA